MTNRKINLSKQNLSIIIKLLTIIFLKKIKSRILKLIMIILIEKRDDTDEIDDEAAIGAASSDMVKEGFAVGREKAVVGGWVGAEIQVASVCK